MGLPVRRVDVYQWISNDGPYIILPVGPHGQPVKFLMDTGAQISILTKQDTEKLGIQPGRQRVKVTRVNGTSVVKLQKLIYGSQARSTCRLLVLQLKIRMKIYLDFDVLNGRIWHLPDGTVWSFGSNVDPNPDTNREATVRVLCAAPTLRESKITNVDRKSVV